MIFRSIMFIMIDALLALLALFSAALVRYDYSELIETLHETKTIYTSAIFVLVILFSSLLMETYDFDKNTKKREIIINVLFAMITSFAFLSIVYYLSLS